jgi:hypothetical protein
MNTDMIRRASLLIFGLAVLCVGCLEGEAPKMQTPQSSPPSVGREYGETLRGAMDKAHSAKDALEASSRALEDADGVSR